MLGVEEGRVFFDASSARGLVGGTGPGAANELPSVADCGIYFRRFLQTFGSREAGILVRQLYKNVEAENFTLELNLQNILQQQSTNEQHAHQEQLDHPCPTTPYCQKSEHRMPTYYIMQLAMALKKRPLTYLPICEKVCMDLCNEHKFVNLKVADLEKETAGIQICLLGDAPPTIIRGLLASQQEKFLIVPGIVVQASKPQHKMRKMCIQCRFCDHKYTVDVPVWKDKPFIPRFCLYAQSQRGAGGLQIEGDLGCLKAKDPYVVLPNECKYIDTQSLKIQELPEDVPTGDMPRHIHVNVSRYLCEKLIPGDRVYLHGVLTSYSVNSTTENQNKDSTHVSYIHVLGFQKYDEAAGEETTFSIEETNQFNKFANAPNVHEKIFSSIAPSIFGMENVKRAAACLLFGGTRKVVGDKSKLRGDINVLLLGDPSVAKSQILKFVDRVAPISVYTSGKGSSAAGLTAAVVRDRHGVFALEGGAMVLADGGVVCIDEFDKMRSDDVVAIHEAMEQQTISISKAGITTMLNSRCAVMAAANPTFGSYDDTIDTTEQHDFKATILSRFDLIFLLKDKDNMEKDTLLVKHILALHANQQEEQRGDMPIHFLKRYIQFAKQQPSPMLSPGAADLLRTFYVKTREEARSDNRSVTRKIPITVRQLESLIRVSESFAKMELAKTAEEKHVMMSIELFNVSTVETAKHALIFETMTPSEQRAVQQAEEAILGRIQKGQRSTRQNLMRDLQMKGFDRCALAKALAILIKRGDLQERGDRSVRRA